MSQVTPATPTVDHDGSSAAVRFGGAPIRIAYVVNTFGMGGLERCAANLINQLDRKQFDPTLICLSRVGGAAQWITASGVEIVELDKRKGNDPSVVWKLARALRERQIDLVHSHNWGTLVETVIARRRAGVTTHIHAEHGLELSDLRIRRWRFKARRAAMRWALNRTNAVVVVDESVREKLVQRSGIVPDKITVVQNGVELSNLKNARSRASEIRASLEFSDDAMLLGSVGRLAPVKDFGTAIDAVAELRQKGRPAHLVLVGDGPERAALLEHSNQCGIEQFVHLVGQQEDVAAWYSAMDVYLNSSVSEGMNLAIMEAMAAGVPSVVTDVGANAVLVAGELACGLVVRPGESSDMANAVDRLLANEQLREEMSKNAQLVYRRNYSTAAMTDRYVALYQKCSASLHADTGGER